MKTNHDEVVKKITEQRGSGATAQEIADALNAAKIKTAKGGVWDRAKVAQFCSRYKLLKYPKQDKGAKPTVLTYSGKSDAPKKQKGALPTITSTGLLVMMRGTPAQIAEVLRAMP